MKHWVLKVMEGEIYSQKGDMIYRNLDRLKVEISSFENVVRVPEKYF